MPKHAEIWDFLPYKNTYRRVSNRFFTIIIILKITKTESRQWGVALPPTGRSNVLIWSTFHKLPFQLSDYSFSSSSKQEGERQRKIFDSDELFAISTIIPCGFWSSGLLWPQKITSIQIHSSKPVYYTATDRQPVASGHPVWNVVLE